ncbi:MAG TPA: hypothetical protein VIT67_22605, partial [Povalibacter sp.]
MRSTSVVSRRWLPIGAVASLCLLSSACERVDITPGSEPIQTLGLLINTPNSSAPTQVALDEATRLALATGVKGTVVMYSWNQLEPTAGQYNLTSLQGELAGHRQRGWMIYLGIRVINTVRRELPADLQSLPFDDPRVLTRFHALIDALAPVLSGAERYLSIGNEVDAYLGNAPAQWAAYQAFYEDALSYVHQKVPSLQVGVTTQFDGYASNNVGNIAALNTRSDFIALTYYPLQPGWQVQSPAAPRTDFPRIVSLASGRPVVLQEAGYPSAALNGSSEQSAAEFVTVALEAWRQQGQAMPFLNYFIEYDFDATTCAAFNDYYGVNDPAFTAFLCSLGLRRADGTAKAAWS